MGIAANAVNEVSGIVVPEARRVGIVLERLIQFFDINKNVRIVCFFVYDVYCRLALYGRERFRRSGLRCL